MNSGGSLKESVISDSVDGMWLFYISERHSLNNRISKYIYYARRYNTYFNQKRRDKPS